MDFDFLDTYSSAIAAVFGGVGVRVVGKMLNRRTEDLSEASRIREELRKEITSLRDELEEWKSEADEWRTKYYAKVEENLKMVTELELLRVDVITLQRQLAQLTNTGQ